MARILVVDDEEADRVLLGTILESAGHEVYSAASSDEALILYSARQVEVVVTDMVMPHSDGLDLIFSLRGIDPRARIIGLSGQSRARLEVATTIGARTILNKPIDRDDLLAAVEDTWKAAEE